MAGDKDEGKKAEGWLLAAGGVRYSASGSGEKITTDLHGQEAGDNGGVGGFTAYFWHMHEGDGLRGRGETPGSVVEISGIGEAAEGHVRREFEGSEGVAATGIRKVWRGRGSGGGFGL